MRLSTLAASAALFTVLVFISAQAAAQPAGMVGESAPAFSLKTPDGAEMTMESLKGQGVILNFWATWCAPCKLEMPLLEKTYNDHKDAGLTVIGVNYQQEAKIIKRFLDKNTLSFPILIDSDGELAKTYNVTGLPSTFFIDRTGKIIGSHIGLIKQENLDEWIPKLLGN